MLDAHVSSRHVGRPLAAAGHDVLALDQNETLSRLPDEQVLVLAAEQGRVVVTHNVRHFASIARRWAEAKQSHAGVILITLPHAAYGPILRGLDRAFVDRSRQEDWIDRTEFLGTEG